MVSLVENNSSLVVSVLKENHRNRLLIVVLKLQSKMLLWRKNEKNWSADVRWIKGVSGKKETIVLKELWFPNV